MKKRVRIYKDGGEPQEGMQMQQQGAPQEEGGGQMEQLVQMVQQMASQGAQPVQVAAELLGQQVPPEAIMQVFVQMGMPQEEAQGSIQEAMQGGQQQAQGPGEEMMEGQASNPQEEMMEPQGPTDEQLQMAFGGPAPLNESSDSYIQDRQANFINTIKRNTFSAAAKQDIFGGDETKMKYGGDLPKADLGDDASKIVYDENKTYKPDGKGGWIEYKPEQPSTNQGVNPNVVYIQQSNPYNQKPLSRMFNAGMRQPGSWNVSGLPQGIDPNSFLNSFLSGQPGGTTKDGIQWGIQNYETLKGGLFGRKNVGPKFNIAWGDQLTNPTTNSNIDQTSLENKTDGLSAGQQIGNQLTRIPGLKSVGANMYSGRTAPENTYVSPVNNQELVPNRNNTADANFGNPVLGVEPRDNISFNNNMPNLFENKEDVLVNQSVAPEVTMQSTTPQATQPVAFDPTTDKDAQEFQMKYPKFIPGQGNDETNQFWYQQQPAGVIKYSPEKEAKMKAAGLNPDVYGDHYHYEKLATKSFGGGITKEDLDKATQTIMMAFGGQLPKAFNGMDIDSLPMRKINEIPNPGLDAQRVLQEPIDLNASGTAEVEARFQKGRINPQWANAAADLGLQTMNGISNFASQMQSFDPEREAALKSSANSYAGQLDNQGYDQFGNFLGGTRMGAQVQNLTNTGQNSQTPVYSLGGKIYDLGGDYELSDDEAQLLIEAGYNVKKH